VYLCSLLHATCTPHYCCSQQDIVNDKSAYELRYFVVRLSDTVTGTRGFSMDKPLLPSFLFMGAVGRTKEVITIACAPCTHYPATSLAVALAAALHSASTIVLLGICLLLTLLLAVAVAVQLLLLRTSKQPAAAAVAVALHSAARRQAGSSSSAGVLTLLTLRLLLLLLLRVLHAVHRLLSGLPHNRSPSQRTSSG
jgi:hypothetical protein